MRLNNLLKRLQQLYRNNYSKKCFYCDKYFIFGGMLMPWFERSCLYSTSIEMCISISKPLSSCQAGVMHMNNSFFFIFRITLATSRGNIVGGQDLQILNFKKSDSCCLKQTLQREKKGTFLFICRSKIVLYMGRPEFLISDGRLKLRLHSPGGLTHSLGVHFGTQ